MKNIIRITGVLMLMITICISSCKKENTQPTLNTGDEIVNYSSKVLSLIKKFDQKMNSILKEDEKIELDSAIWNVEALQNYTYAFPDSSTKEFYVFRDYYTLDVNANNKVWLSDVQDLNDEMETDYQSNLNSLQSEVQLMHFCDVVLDSVEGNTAYISAISGFGTNLLLNTYWSFSEDDDWIWGTLGESQGSPPVGKCDETMQGVSDGSNEIAWRLNNPLASSQPSGYTNLVTLEAGPYDFPDGNGGYRIYLDETATLDNCLHNEDLEYFLYEADEIINSPYELEVGLCPPGKSFVSIHIEDTYTSPGMNIKYVHYYLVTYGVAYTNPN